MQSVLKSSRQVIQRQAEQARRRVRPKVSEGTIQRRKEIKKLRHVNIFSVDHTGERLYHPWLEPKRIRSLMMSYQDMQNKHRHTLAIDDKDKQEMIEKNTEYAMYKYWTLINDHAKLEKHNKVHSQLVDDTDSLPFNLRNEVKEQYKKSYKHPERPELLKNYNLYYEQIMRLYPDDYTDGIKLGKRLQHIIEEKLGENE